VAGINAPDILYGDVNETGLSVFHDTRQVQIGLEVDQIVNVDQRSENFTLVGSLQLIWEDPQLAFSPDSCDCALKKMGINDLRSLAVKDNVIMPAFTFFNQQGNRWSQNALVFIEPSGRTTYRERFTVTLQAPDFDFQAYPFDRQLFKARIDLNVPTEIFAFEGIETPGSPVGDQLGEEEWTVVKYSQVTEKVPLDENLKKSRYTLTLEVKRHLNYYVYRILMPFLLIICVSWVIFFLKDYGRQLEVASGNLLIFMAFNFTISDDLPRLGYLTLLDRMIITGFVCAALVVFISVYQKRLEAKGKKEVAARIDNVVLIFYPLIFISVMTLEYILGTR
jgi:hypothetical protein